MMNQNMKNTSSTNPTPMHSLSVSSESSEEVLPELDMMPEVMPAIGRTLIFVPELDRRVVGVRVVDVDHEELEEPDECVELLRDADPDERVELREEL